MGLLSSIECQSLEGDRTELTMTQALAVLGGGPTFSGVTVTERNALNFLAVASCHRVICQTVAQLPLVTYRRLERGSERAREHRLYSVLHERANEEMAAFNFRETVQGHLLGWGNAYIEKEFDRGGRVIGLWPLPPDRTRVERRGGKKLIVTHVPDRSDEWRQVALTTGPKGQAIHLPGWGYDGLRGYSPIQMMRQAIGIGLAAEEFQARWFSNGAHLGLVAEHPGVLGSEAKDKIRASLEILHGGLTNAHRIAVLEEGMKLSRVGLSPQDSQLLETRTFTKREIASWYRVPLHMLQDLERSTNNNIEHQGLEFVVHTMMPWFVLWEQILSWELFPVEPYYCKFTVDALLRGDAESRAKALQILRQNGIINADHWRELYEWNPIGGIEGERYWMPKNMTDAGTPVVPDGDPLLDLGQGA